MKNIFWKLLNTTDSKKTKSETLKEEQLINKNELSFDVWSSSSSINEENNPSFIQKDNYQTNTTERTLLSEEESEYKIREDSDEEDFDIENYEDEERQSNQHVLKLNKDFFEFDKTDLKKTDFAAITSLLYIAQQAKTIGPITCDWGEYVSTFFLYLKRQGRTQEEIKQKILDAIEKLTSNSKDITKIINYAKIIKEEHQRPQLKFLINKKYKYILENYNNENSIEINYETLIKMKAKTAIKLYLFLLHYKGTADKNGYHITKITKKQLIEELDMKPDSLTPSITTTLNRAMEYFKKDKIFEEIKYKPIKKSCINPDGYKYKKIMAYEFTWK